MKGEFITVNGYFNTELTEKKSRFIAHIKGVNSKCEAEEFFDLIRNRYADARHNVPAYRIGIETFEEWANDDGEPAGTAGKPVLDMLRNSGLTNVAVMVTRYFGGILLGTGGLVRAYGGVTAKLLSEIPKARKKLHRRIYVEADYKLLGRIKRYLDTLAVFNDMNCAQNVVFTYDVPAEKISNVKSELVELCAGQVTIQEGEEIYLSVG